MARLQDLLSQSVTQSLGLSDILARREEEARQAGEVERLKGQVEAARIRGKAREKRGMFETLGTIAGAAGGFALGGPVGASVGAKLGQSVGGDLSGKSPDNRASKTSQDIQSAIGLGLNLQQLGQQTRFKQQEIDLKKQQMSLKGNEDIRKKVLDVQSQGKGILESDFTGNVDNLPSNAFINIGSGKNQVRMIKSPKQLQPESAAKLAGIQQASTGINGLLNDFNSGNISTDDIRASVIPGSKRLPEQQQISSALSFNKEILARVFSGAAVPESEQKRFQEIFSIQPLDTSDTIRLKLKRNIDMAEKIQNSVLYGASLSADGVIDTKVASDIIKKELSNVGNQLVPEFSSVEEVERQNLPKGSIFIVNGRVGVIE
tara:strand:+ start:3619 stop:4743 length:1125 start_codon:yes stop_codon:yes gene_type:complete